MTRSTPHHDLAGEIRLRAPWGCENIRWLVELGLKAKKIVTPVVEPTDLELIRKIAAAGGRKYTAGNLGCRKYQRLVALGWLTEVSVNISDVLYEVTEAGKAAALRDD